jgi:hypothetical protein
MNLVRIWKEAFMALSQHSVGGIEECHKNAESWYLVQILRLGPLKYEAELLITALQHAAY